MTDYPHITIDGEPLTVLTNGCCESTGYWSPEQFQHLELDYAAWGDEDYPLTDEEAVLIADDAYACQTPVGGLLFFGYSALYQGKKWLMPSIEYMKPIQQEDIEDERRTLNALVSPYQGCVVYQEDGPEDRVTVLILVPLQEVQNTFGHINVWKRFLERGLGIPAKDEEHFSLSS